MFRTPLLIVASLALALSASVAEAATPPALGSCIWEATPSAAKARLLDAGPDVGTISDRITNADGWTVALACNLPDSRPSGRLVFTVMHSSALAEASARAFESDYGISRAQLTAAWSAMPLRSRESYARRALYQEPASDKAQSDLNAVGEALNLKSEAALKLLSGYVLSQSVVDYVRDRSLKALLADF